MKRECKRCGKTFDREELEEHHLIPTELLDKELSDRLRVLLCEYCHNWATGKFVDEGIIWLPNSKNLKVKE